MNKTGGRIANLNVIEERITTITNCDKCASGEVGGVCLGMLSKPKPLRTIPKNNIQQDNLAEKEKEREAVQREKRSAVNVQPVSHQNTTEKKQRNCFNISAAKWSCDWDSQSSQSP